YRFKLRSLIVSYTSHYRAFSFSIRPRISCSLFPYTTLFRSHRFREKAILGVMRVLAGHAPGVVRTLFYRKEFFMITDPRTVARGDRKSTRLNSSHRTISYAVFCLKKKTNSESTYNMTFYLNL